MSDKAELVLGGDSSGAKKALDDAATHEKALANVTKQHEASVRKLNGELAKMANNLRKADAENRKLKQSQSGGGGISSAVGGIVGAGRHYAGHAAESAKEMAFGGLPTSIAGLVTAVAGVSTIAEAISKSVESFRDIRAEQISYARGLVGTGAYGLSGEAGKDVSEKTKAEEVANPLKPPEQVQQAYVTNAQQQAYLGKPVADAIKKEVGNMAVQGVDSAKMTQEIGEMYQQYAPKMQGTEQQKVEAISNSLVAATRGTGVTLKQLTEHLGEVEETSRKLNLSLPETLGIFTKLSQAAGADAAFDGMNKLTTKVAQLNNPYEKRPFGWEEYRPDPGGDMSKDIMQVARIAKQHESDPTRRNQDIAEFGKSYGALKKLADAGPEAMQAEQERIRQAANKPESAALGQSVQALKDNPDLRKAYAGEIYARSEEQSRETNEDPAIGELDRDITRATIGMNNRLPTHLKWLSEPIATAATIVDAGIGDPGADMEKIEERKAANHDLLIASQKPLSFSFAGVRDSVKYAADWWGGAAKTAIPALSLAAGDTVHPITKSLQDEGEAYTKKKYIEGGGDEKLWNASKSTAKAEGHGGELLAAVEANTGESSKYLSKIQDILAAMMAQQAQARQSIKDAYLASHGDRPPVWNPRPVTEGAR